VFNDKKNDLKPDRESDSSTVARGKATASKRVRRDEQANEARTGNQMP
jgi:hypothetical protein